MVSFFVLQGAALTAHLGSSINLLHFVAHTCGLLVLYYQDGNFIVGVYSALCAWECLIRHFIM